MTTGTSGWNWSEVAPVWDHIGHRPPVERYREGHRRAGRPPGSPPAPIPLTGEPIIRKRSSPNSSRRSTASSTSRNTKVASASTRHRTSPITTCHDGHHQYRRPAPDTPAGRAGRAGAEVHRLARIDCVLGGCVSHRASSSVGDSRAPVGSATDPALAPIRRTPLPPATRYAPTRR